MFWWLLWQLFAVTHAFFDVDEINNVKYGIDILDTPVTAGEDSDVGRVLLASKFGQQYQCSFTEREQHVDVDERRREQEALETGIIELLKPIKDGDCLTLTKGWWTYELCYGEHIRQYHVEDGIAQNINYLGFYESELDWSTVTEEKTKSAKERYHSQEYVNGTICDLTGKPRKAQVRYYCEPDIGDYLLAVDEFETCVYTLFVHTERICHHPYLKPARRAKAVPITCHPLLTDEEYKDYTEMTASQEDKSNTPLPSAEEAAGKLDSWQDYNVDPAVDALQKLITQSLTAGFGNSLGADGKHKKIKVKEIKTLKLKKRDLASATEEIVSNTNDEDTKGDEHDEDHTGDGNEDYKMTDDGSEMTQLDGEDDMSGQDDGALGFGSDEDNVDVDDDDDDSVLLKEFDKGLDELAKSGRYLEEITQYKEEIKKEMSSQFTEIIREAEDELNAAGFKEEVDRDSVLKTMSETLEKLVRKLEEKQATGRRKETSSTVDKAASIAMKTLESELTKDGDDGLQLDTGDATDGEVMKLSAGDAAVDVDDDEKEEEVMTITKHPHSTGQSSSDSVRSSSTESRDDDDDDDDDDDVSLEYEIKYGDFKPADVSLDQPQVRAGADEADTMLPADDFDEQQVRRAATEAHAVVPTDHSDGPTQPAGDHTRSQDNREANDGQETLPESSNDPATPVPSLNDKQSKNDRSTVVYEDDTITIKVKTRYYDESKVSETRSSEEMDQTNASPSKENKGRETKTKTRDRTAVLRSAERQVQEAVERKLSESGVKTSGQTIQIKIFTADDYMNVDGEASPFHTNGALNRMLVAVLGANTDEMEEAKRQEKLNNNYGFVWKKAKNRKRSISESDSH